MKRSIFRLTGIGLVVLALVIAAFFAAHYVENSSTAQRIVEDFGILGILTIAFISGLNLIVPIHAATFTPVFSAAGFGLPVIVLLLAIGTTVADLISYLLGRWGRHATGEHMTKVKEKVDTFARDHRPFILPGVFLYASFVPFPNEAILIPLGLMGFRLKIILIPLILGTILNQTIFALGFTSAFNFFF